MKKVCIVGMGWLGKELAVELEKNKFSVTGTTSTVSKIDGLKQLSSNVELFELGGPKNFIEGEFDFIIYTIPPSSNSDYANLSCELIANMHKINPNAAWIYTSSTSVYGYTERTVTEEIEVQPESESAKKIVEVEHCLQDNMSSSAILRLGGFVGGERHPVKYLAGKSNVSKPFAVVNLLHREDAVNAILFLTRNFQPGIYNLCSEDHPQKKEFFSGIAARNNLLVIGFDEDDFTKDKVVTCNAMKKIGFEFKYTSPYDFPFEL